MSPSVRLPSSVSDAEIQAAINAAADRWWIPRDLALAVCITESALNPWAMRFEPDYSYLWNSRSKEPYHVASRDMESDRAPFDFYAPPQLAATGYTAHSEWIAQQTSYGLMQTMGSVAREYGFEGYLTALCDPVFSCDVGCHLLHDLATRYCLAHGWVGVLAAYNAGSPRRVAITGPFVNQGYVDKVLKNGGPALRAALGVK